MIKPRQSIFWHQGMFLKPHHFQSSDLYFESLLSPFRTYLQPFFWGTCVIDVDEGALKDMTFDLKSGEFIFQDGSWVSIAENGKIKSRSFRELWNDSKEPFTVFIALRKWNYNGSNVSMITGGNDQRNMETRFLCDENQAEVIDFYQKNENASISMLDFNLKFIWEHEREQFSDYNMIPVARIEFNGQDAFLSQDFVPPTVTLASSSVLLRIAKNIREIVSSRTAILSEYKNPKGLSGRDFQPSYMNFMLAMRSLNRYVPLLYQYISVPHMHPWNFYLLIMQFIAELSSFTERVDALGLTPNGVRLLPEYDHENIGFCFKQAYLLIDEILETLLKGMENIIHLVRDGDYFSASAPSNLLMEKNIFYLRIKTGSDLQDVLNKSKHIIKMGSQEEMPVLIQRSLPGLSIEYDPEPPPGLPRRPDVFYFKIDIANKHWQSVQKNASICLFWSSAVDDTVVDLIILKQ